jgi:hypothetical protein
MIEKYTFEQLDEEIQFQIMFELCDIGQLSKSWGEVVEIENQARLWISKNNEPKTTDEWQSLVVSKRQHQ